MNGGLHQQMILKGLGNNCQRLVTAHPEAGDATDLIGGRISARDDLPFLNFECKLSSETVGSAWID